MRRLFVIGCLCVSSILLWWIVPASAPPAIERSSQVHAYPAPTDGPYPPPGTSTNSPTPATNTRVPASSTPTSTDMPTQTVPTSPTRSPRPTQTATPSPTRQTPPTVPATRTTTATSTVTPTPTREAPTAIHLHLFQATFTAKGVVITWETSLEYDTLGFHLTRGMNQATRERITPSLILAQGRGLGARYRRVDPNPPAAGVGYWLEEVSLSGTTAVYGPVYPGRAVAQTSSRLYLPLVMQMGHP